MVGEVKKKKVTPEKGANNYRGEENASTEREGGGRRQNQLMEKNWYSDALNNLLTLF